MYNAFWRHTLFVRGQSFSVKTFDRSPNGCQVIRLGRETIFVGLPGRCSLSSRVSSSLGRVFSCAHYFQASASQAIQIGDTEREVIIRKVIERSYFKKQDLYFFLNRTLKKSVNNL